MDKRAVRAHTLFLTVAEPAEGRLKLAAVVMRKWQGSAWRTREAVSPVTSLHTVGACKGQVRGRCERNSETGRRGGQRKSTGNYTSQTGTHISHIGSSNPTPACPGTTQGIPLEPPSRASHAQALTHPRKAALVGDPPEGMPALPGSRLATCPGGSVMGMRCSSLSVSSLHSMMPAPTISTTTAGSGPARLASAASRLADSSSVAGVAPLRPRTINRVRPVPSLQGNEAHTQHEAQIGSWCCLLPQCKRPQLNGHALSAARKASLWPACAA
jgi:hypothetical protein